jgi:hypothetical protein
MNHTRSGSRCRIATVEAQTKLVLLTLKRDTFTEILGPLEQLIKKEKSPQVVAQKMAKLQPRGAHVHRAPAEVLIKRKKKGRNGETWEVVRARGHLDEVQELRKGGTKLVGACITRLFLFSYSMHADVYWNRCVWNLASKCINTRDILL